MTILLYILAFGLPVALVVVAIFTSRKIVHKSEVLDARRQELRNQLEMVRRKKLELFEKAAREDKSSPEESPIATLIRARRALSRHEAILRARDLLRKGYVRSEDFVYDPYVIGADMPDVWMLTRSTK